MVGVRFALALFVAIGAAYLSSVELDWNFWSSVLLAFIIMAVYGLTELELDRVSHEEEEQPSQPSYLGGG